MALTFTFKAGAQQSREAGQYFSQVASEMLETGLGDMAPCQLVLTEDGMEPMPLRIWTGNEPTSEDLADWVPWIRSVHAQMHDIGSRKADLGLATQAAERWVQERHMETTFFAEILHPAHAFTPDEDNTLSVGILGGETVLLSSRNVMFMKLATDQFGLAIAQRGSFLIERISPDRQAHARRA